MPVPRDALFTVCIAVLKILTVMLRVGMEENIYKAAFLLGELAQ